ncbi:ROK family transcriptional regulator [Psychromonas hadalis]|uniref:ROK family transcriptional regulator n=1 Tax=Psychromonas hadalis TaxID=211669 RepID=UPI0003B5AA44|nr:ROK family transcriptional regulator [Psychromonas hadalis]
MQQTSSKMISTIANIDHIKQVNCATIYKVIEQHAPISRVKIAKVSQLAPASVTKITRHLIEKGIITETERQPSTGGRCAISLAPNSQKIYVIAAKIGRKFLSISHYNLAGKKSIDKRFNIEDKKGESLISLLRREIKSLIDDELQQGNSISAISITLSGLINPQQGKIIYTELNGLNNFPLVQVIEQAFNIPTFIGNHTRALALAEHYFGATQQSQDSIVISIHHGVGSGIIMQGKALLGVNCNIGEIGHIQVNPTGKQCHCGNFGCLETEVSDTVIVEKVQIAIENGEVAPFNNKTLNIEDIYLAAASGDPLCEKIVSEAASYLGKTIAILVNILNPEKIVISGKITTAKNTLFSAIQQCIVHQSLPDFHKKVIIQATELQPNSTIASFALIKKAIYEGDLLQKINIKN